MHVHVPKNSNNNLPATIQKLKIQFIYHTCCCCERSLKIETLPLFFILCNGTFKDLERVPIFQCCWWEKILNFDCAVMMEYSFVDYATIWMVLFEKIFFLKKWIPWDYYNQNILSTNTILFFKKRNSSFLLVIQINVRH